LCLFRWQRAKKREEKSSCRAGRVRHGQNQGWERIPETIEKVFVSGKEKVERSDED